jgi:hypothetical protein
MPSSAPNREINLVAEKPSKQALAGMEVEVE